MFSLHKFTPWLRQTNPDLVALIVECRLNTSETVFVTVKLLERLARFTITQGSRKETIYTGRLVKRGDDPFIERLASLRVFVSILEKQGFASIRTDSPAINATA